VPHHAREDERTVRAGVDGDLDLLNKKRDEAQLSGRGRDVEAAVAVLVAWRVRRGAIER